MAYYDEFQPGQVLNFTAERGGVDKEYTVTLRKQGTVITNKWTAMYKGQVVGISFYKSEPFINRMTSYRGTKPVTICKYGVINNG